MAAHVDFLGLLFVIWGALTALVGVSTLALGAGAIALMTSGRSGGGQVAAGLTAAVFAILAVIALVWGIAHIVVGVPLRRRSHWARILALVLGSLDLVLLPYGTALGCYTLYVLLSEQGRVLFESADGGVQSAE